MSQTRLAQSLDIRTTFGACADYYIFDVNSLANEPIGAEVEDLHYYVLVPRSLR